MGKCHVKDEWLLKDDDLGFKINSWCRKLNDTEVFCKICASNINVKAKGLQAITQHALSVKHRGNAKIKLDGRQMRLTAGLPPVVSNNSKSIPNPEETGSLLTMYSVKDAATRAELLWAMKSVVNNYSAASHDDIEEVFREMFPGAVPQGFCLSRTKLTYVITEALGPHFREVMLHDIKSEFFTIQYDETTNAEGKKELQVAVRHYSQSTGEVVFHHLETFFMGHAKAEDLLAKLNEAIDNADLDRRKLLMLASDGPNVNKKVSRLMNAELKKVFCGDANPNSYQGLLDIGTCNIHVVHNAFLKAMDAFGKEISDLVLNIYYFFDDWPSRQEDYEGVQAKQPGVPNHQFIKHVSSRWLTLIPALDRVLEQWPALVKFFLEYIPKYRKELLKVSKYQLIVDEMKKNGVLATMKFIKGSSELFIRFTGMMQRQEPLIHILYEELKLLVTKLLNRVFEEQFADLDVEAVFDVREVYKKKFIPLDKLVFDDDITSELDTLSQRERMEFCFNAQQHSVAAAKHLLKTVPMGKGSIVHYLKAVHPEQIKGKCSLLGITEVNRCLSLGVQTSIQRDEWTLLQNESLPDSSEFSRVDHFWTAILNAQNGFGESKYPNVGKVVKAILSLAHGSADVERGFSRSGRVLTDDKASMSVRTLNARLNVQDGLRRFKNRPALVPITDKLLLSAQMSHRSYLAHLEEKKRKDEIATKLRLEEEEKAKQELITKARMEKSKSDIQTLERRLKESQKAVAVKQKATDQLLQEASDRLKKALLKNDQTAAQLAQGMIDGAMAMRLAERNALKSQDELSRKISEKKSIVISNKKL